MNFKETRNIIERNKFNFIHLSTTPSTMDDAKINLKKLKSNLVIIADQQTNGKGRRGNVWISPPGNFYCSIIIKNDLPLKNYFFFSAIVALSVRDSLKNNKVDNIKFKWPNDIFYEDKKFGGIILESYNFKNENYVIIGLGLNIVSAPEAKNYKTTFIQSFFKIKNIDLFLNIFFDNFFIKLNNLVGDNNIIEDFKKSLMFLNEKIIINDNNKNITGVFKGINNDGSLILSRNNKIISIYSGHIVL